MRNLLCLILMMGALGLCGCGVKTVEGSGNVITEQRPVSSFSAVSLKGSGKLIINQTGRESLTITADDNLMPYLTSDVSGTQLILGTARSTNVQPSEAVIYKLDVGKLVEIEVSGSGNVDAPGIVTNGLKVQANGSTKLNLSGQADVQEINIAGTAEYQASDLKSKEVIITIAGSGNLVVSASEKLDVTITGSGSVEYIGDPVVSQHITGAGSVRKR